jgi:hypothetical protein
MRELAVLAQVAADFALRPVIYEWQLSEYPVVARPTKGCRKPYHPLRMDLQGAHTDAVVGAVLRGAKSRQIEWAIAYIEDIYQVTVWRRPDAETTFPASHHRQDLALLDALADLSGVLL